MTLIEKHIEKLKNGNSSSLEQVYLITKNAVFSIIFSITKNYQQSEDLMQETYIKVHNNINSYKKGTNAKSWIYTIARNLALNYYKKQKREVFTDFNEMANLFPSYEINAKDESGVFKIMAETLNDNEQKIVTMHTIGGIKLKEIALILDKSQGTVRWQYNNALKKMLKKINKED